MMEERSLEDTDDQLTEDTTTVQTMGDGMATIRTTTEVSSTYTTFSTKTATTTIATMMDTMIAMITAMTKSLNLHLLGGYNVYVFISTTYLGSHYLHQN
jgi:hypothetical protein